MTVELVERRARSSPSRTVAIAPPRPDASSSSAWWPRTRPGSSGSSTCCPNQNGARARHRPARPPADLPERVQAWAPLDRLIWQDVDAASLTPAQLAALRTWIAGGGRLVIVGGTGARGRRCRRSPTTCSPTARPALVDVDPAVAPAGARRRRPPAATPRDRLRGRPGHGPHAGDVGRPRDRRGRRVRLGLRDPARLRPRDVVDRRWRRDRRARSGAGSCRRARAARSRSSTTRPSSARSPTCRASPCRRSARLLVLLRATSCSSAP